MGSFFRRVLDAYRVLSGKDDAVQQGIRQLQRQIAEREARQVARQASLEQEILTELRQSSEALKAIKDGYQTHEEELTKFAESLGEAGRARLEELAEIEAKTLLETAKRTGLNLEPPPPFSTFVEQAKAGLASGEAADVAWGASRQGGGSAGPDGPPPEESLEEVIAALEAQERLGEGAELETNESGEQESGQETGLEGGQEAVGETGSQKLGSEPGQESSQGKGAAKVQISGQSSIGQDAQNEVKDQISEDRGLDPSTSGRVKGAIPMSAVKPEFRSDGSGSSSDSDSDDEGSKPVGKSAGGRNTLQETAASEQPVVSEKRPNHTSAPSLPKIPEESVGQERDAELPAGKSAREEIAGFVEIPDESARASARVVEAPGGAVVGKGGPGSGSVKTVSEIGICHRNGPGVGRTKQAGHHDNNK